MMGDRTKNENENREMWMCHPRSRGGGDDDDDKTRLGRVMINIINKERITVPYTRHE